MKKKILFIKRGNTRFENNDIEILSRKFDVKIYEPNFSNLFSCITYIKNTDLIFYWFPNDYKFIISIIGKFFRKRIFVIGGGQMSTADNKNNRKFAKVKYRFFHRILGIGCLKLADKVVAVSKYELNGLSRYVNKKSIKLIYNSINTNLFSFKNKKRDNNLIITVSGLKNTHYFRKGLDIFVNISKKMPEYNFVLIGKDSNDGTFQKVENNVNNNFLLTGSVTDLELDEWMQKASIYCQFSRQEGFGVALAEAMACGCIPVVSSYGAIPEVAGKDAFFISKKYDYEDIERKIIEALKSNIDRNIFSKRINNLFNDHVRDDILLNEVSNLISSK